MRKRLSFLATGLVLALSSPAAAAPIPFANGLLDGVLRTYTFEDPLANNSPLVLFREYTLGTDFYPAVPLSFQQNAVPYDRCAGVVQPSNPPECLSFFFPVTTEIFGQGDLQDGCSFIANGLETPPRRPIMVARGGCSFLDKWAFAESQGWGGVMVVNILPGPADATGLGQVPLADEPTIPFMRLSQETGQQIRDDVETDYAFFVEMSVSWRPNATPVPEPTSLVLLGTGLAAGVFPRLRRRK